jgi:hypothetical protein
VVIADASDGAWVTELDPANRPQEPVQFFHVREGVFGPVLHSSGLILFRQELLTLLSKLTPGEFRAYRASIRRVHAAEARLDYSVIKIPRKTPIASLCDLPVHSGLSVVAECVDSVVVSRELGLQLARSVSGLALCEPRFVGSPPAA